jgi:hypothetical protein
MSSFPTSNRSFSQRLLRNAIRRELADAQAALAQAEDRGVPDAVADARRVVSETLERLRDLTNLRSNQPYLRHLGRPRAAHVSVVSRLDVTEEQREQLRADLRRILNKETPE